MKNPTNFRNGYHDGGSQLSCGQTECPNCNSKRFVESVSCEKCYDCGLECNYWGEGPNAVYQNMMDRRYAAERARDEQRERDERKAWGAEHYWWDNYDT